MALKLSTGLVNQILGLAAGSPAGKGLGELFELGVLKIYGSPRPADADSTETGTLLCTITDASGTYTPADGTNGLSFDDPASGVLSKEPTQTWSGVAVASGTAVWYRFYPVGTSVTGATTTIARIDGSIGTSGADLNMSSTSIVSGATQTVDSFTWTMPQSS